MPVRLHVLGGLHAFRDAVPLAWVPAQRVRSALLVYLALTREAARDQLAQLLWPDEAAERARHALSQTLYLLRQAFGESCIENTGQLLRFGAPVECDALQFEGAVARGDLVQAVSLYRGAFLKDVSLSESPEFEAWVDRERAKYGRLHRRACRLLIDGLVGERRLVEAIEAAREWVSLEPFDDEAQHRLIELLAANGQRSDALEHYGLYEKLLARDELVPLDETRALVAQLRASELGRIASVTTSLPEVAGAATDHAARSPGAPRGPPAADDLVAALERELRPDLELLRPLGQGRNGRVFLARETRLDRLVAVKVLASELTGDRVARARFEREARAAAALAHPNAVSVYRFGFLADGMPYLVMQYVKGVTLEDRLAAEGLLPVPQARRVLAEVADALAAAHRSGFVHRDLRPNNVLCDEESGRVLVSDFGLAGILPRARGGEEAITGAGEMLCVPDYASPELLRGESASEGSDVYALGVMGYQLLAGSGPFPAMRAADALALHLNRPPRPLRSLRPDADEQLAELLERCLAKDPSKRPRAAFLARALRAGAAGPAESADARAPATIRRGLLQRLLPKLFALLATVALPSGTLLIFT